MKPKIFRKLSLNRTIFVCLTCAAALSLTAPGRAQTAPQYTISTVVGAQSTTGGYAGDGAAATGAMLDSPSGVVYAGGNIYFADSANNVIRYVTGGTIHTVAGNGTATAGVKQLGDGGQATSGELTGPFGLTVDSSGNIYIADTGDEIVQFVTAAGKISTYAGSYTNGANYGGDGGSASTAYLDHPGGVALDSKGNLYIADTLNNVIRKVVPGSAVGTPGVITTVAGNNALQDYQGDGGPATKAGLDGPEGVAVDAAGNIYIADTRNHCIRMVTAATQIITTFAGVCAPATGIGGYGGDGGPATKALLWNPEGVAVDSAGNVYIADSFNNRIRIVSNGIINTIAGNGSPYYGGDGGLATNAQMKDPSGLGLDGLGNIYVADTGNNVIRLLTRAAAPPPVPVVSAVENAANFQVSSSTNGAAANSYISVYASNLGTASGSNLFPATSFQGIQVLFNGTAAPLYYVNGAVNLINLVLPSNLGTSGTATVNVQTSAGTSSNFTLTLAPFNVGIFRLSADPAHPNNGAITIANSQALVMPASTATVYGLKPCTGLPASSICGQPALPGNTISIYFTGGGLATPNGAPSGQPVPAGQVAPASGSPLYETVQTPVVTIGGLSAQVSFSGIAPGTAGEYQINATIPANVGTGDSVPVMVTFGSSSDTVTISVQ